jgi:uncharacterized integral membrane protein (TIGR00698 family)
MLLAAVLLALPLLYLGNPAIALLIGGVLAVASNKTLHIDAPKWSKLCLQSAIVLLGLRLNVETIWTLSADYALLTTGYVIITVLAGLALGAILSAGTVSSQLIASGTAICGGTAIASLSPLLGARPHETAVALALVFLLNVVAVFSFPLIGHWLQLSQLEFGLWSAIAIHDTSSVVATAGIYGSEAQEVATTIKLGRTLWLIPAVFIASLVGQRGSAKLRVPGFILLFIAAAALGSVVPLPAVLVAGASVLSKGLLVAALFFVGTELTRSTIAEIHGRVAWQAILLWLTVAPLSLLVILTLTR